MNWHYINGNETVGPVTQEELVRQISAGNITAETKVWRDGMQDWQDAKNTEFSHLFTPAGYTADQIYNAAGAEGEIVREGFRDPTFLTNWVKTFLILGIIMAAIAVYSGYRQFNLLNDIKNGAYSSQEQMQADAYENDTRHTIIGICQFGVAIITGISFLVWVHRANYNVRKLGAQNMKFTPGWAVGWFFVPIASLWKPYLVMKEIWENSREPNDHDRSGITLLNIWWMLFLVSIIFTNVASKASVRAEEIEEIMRSTMLLIVADFLGILVAVAIFALVSMIYSMQMSRVRRLFSPLANMQNGHAF
ncbi:MAG: DUF4328 domain-containing protein [Planctomycetota bacterium]|jgi:hypothetical protein